jgi:hypothetical protein
LSIKEQLGDRPGLAITYGQLGLLAEVKGKQQIVVEVEAALAAGPNGHRHQYVDPISLGALVVSIATLAWQVYTDLKARSSKPSKELVSRRVRIQLQDSDQPSTPDGEQIVDIVVDETLKEGEQAD